MLRRLAAAVACAILLAAVPTGSLYVTTLPSGADVWVDGTYVGRSPLVIGALSAGHHSVGLAKTGWNPVQLDVSVVSGQTTLSSSKLDAVARSGVRLPGTVAVHGLAPEATFVDGVPAAPSKDGTYAVPSGTHEMTFRTRRGRMTRTVTVWPTTRTDVVLQAEIEQPRPSVVAPAEDYVPRSAVRIEGEKVVVRYGNHEVIGRLGSTAYRVDGRVADYGEAPAMIGPRLYLPLDLLTLLSTGRR